MCSKSSSFINFQAGIIIYAFTNHIPRALYLLGIVSQTTYLSCSCAHEQKTRSQSWVWSIGAADIIARFVALVAST